MKKILSLLTAFSLSSTAFVAYGASPWNLGLIDALEKHIKKPTEAIFLGVVEEKQKQVAELKTHRAKITEEFDDSAQKYAIALDDIKQEIAKIRAETPETEFNKQKLALLNEIYEIMKDFQRAQKQCVASLDEYINLLVDFLKDPDFIHYFQNQKELPDRVYYTFEEVLTVYDTVIKQEKQVELLIEEEKAINSELENRKRSSIAAQEAFRKRKDELKEAARTTTALLSDRGTDYSSHEAIELLNLQERLFNKKRELDALRNSMTTYKAHSISLQLYSAKGQVVLLKDYLTRIRSSIRVTDAEVAKSDKDCGAKQQAYYAEKESLRLQLEQLIGLQKTREKEREETSKRFNVTLDKDLDEWNKPIKKSVDWFIGMCTVGTINTEVLLLQQKQRLLDAQISLEDIRAIYSSMQLRGKESYYKITNRKFVTEEDIVQEIKEYTTPKEEALGTISQYRDKVSVIATQLGAQKTTLDHVIALKNELVKNKPLFKERPQDLIPCIALLNKAEESVRKNIDILGKLTGIYSGISSTSTSLSRLIDFIVSELKTITIWYRPEYAISLRGIRNIFSETSSFFSGIKEYITHSNIHSVGTHFVYSLKHPFTILFFLIKIFGLLVLLGLIRRFGIHIITQAQNYNAIRQPIAHFIMLLAFVFIGFIIRYFSFLSIWILAFLSLRLCAVTEPYVYILFYLLSIPYLLFLANRCIQYVIQFNVRYDYVFLDPDFQRRFVAIISTLLYATIIIFFFRRAFTLANYYPSELPTILHAANFIIFQISLILLISKDMILYFISMRTPSGMWFRSIVNKYYFLIQLCIIAIIIMINPYVGYSKLVRHILYALICTGLLITFLVWTHGFLKKFFSKIFFIVDDEIIRERFTNAKTFFGLVIIASFLSFVCIGFIASARIWGWPITIRDVIMLINEPLLLKGTQTPITVWSLFMVIAFVAIGFIISYGLNSFVFDKIFDLLLVDAGIQHTVTSIAQYVVVIIALFFGLQNVGLGELVKFFIAALTLSLGWILREPISDFIAYFVILVQRPIKIGDYIHIDTDIIGVVRKITARSVILRRKNSVTVIVPNSTVIIKNVKNWNCHSFFAFNDIIIYVDYKEDPYRVRELLQQAVQAHPNILRSPQPIIRLELFGEFGLRFMVRGFLSSVYVLEQWDIESDIRLTIVKSLRDNNIKIAIRAFGVTMPEDIVLE